MGPLGQSLSTGTSGGPVRSEVGGKVRSWGTSLSAMGLGATVSA